MPDVSIDFLVLILNTDKRSLLEPNIITKCWKKEFFFFVSMVFEGFNKLKELLA